MCDLDTISRLYANVLYAQIRKYDVSPIKIRSGIESMASVYAPGSSSFESDFNQFLNFNNVSLRCAYLHKYAPLHTYIVFDVMLKALKHQMLIFRKLVRTNNLKICCLGGGPGCDVTGVLAALGTEFSSFESSATIIDCKERWKSTFEMVMRELTLGEYDRVWKSLAENLKWSYVEADLLHNITDEVSKSISASSLVTMVKFLSAVVCKNTEYMLEMVFSVMKPGALLLFVDNDGGGFIQLMRKVARKNKFTTLLGPLRQIKYSEEAFNVKRFGYNSCYTTTVCVLLLQKPSNLREKGKVKSPGQIAGTVNERTPLLHAQKMNKIPSKGPFKEVKIKPGSSDSFPSVNSNNRSEINSTLEFTAQTNTFKLLDNSNTSGVQMSITYWKLFQRTDSNKLPTLHKKSNKSFEEAINSEAGMLPKPCTSASSINYSPITTPPISNAGTYYNTDASQNYELQRDTQYDDDEEVGCCSCCVLSES